MTSTALGNMDNLPRLRRPVADVTGRGRRGTLRSIHPAAPTATPSGPRPSICAAARTVKSADRRPRRQARRRRPRLHQGGGPDRLRAVVPLRPGRLRRLGLRRRFRHLRRSSSPPAIALSAPPASRPRWRPGPAIASPASIRTGLPRPVPAAPVAGERPEHQSRAPLGAIANLVPVSVTASG